MKTVLALCLFLAVPAYAQENRAAAGSGANRGGGAQGGSHGGGGGGTAVARGGGTASNGGNGGGGSAAAGSGGSGGSRVTAGGRHTANGGSGVAVHRGSDGGTPAGPRRGESTGTGSTANGGTVSARPTGSGGDRAIVRDGAPRDAHTPDGGPARVPHARPRDGKAPIVGTAVPRGSVPSAPRGGTTIVTRGFYPWWFGGAGYYGGYFGGYYGPYGGYYDPWFGGYPDYDPQPPIVSGFSDEGSLRLKIKPRDAEVYVDGYYVGIVDEFDGVFQKLHLESGTHRIEVRAPGYEPLTFDVRITPDRVTTYRGELTKLP